MTWAITQGSGYWLLLPLAWSLILYSLRKLRLPLDHPRFHSMVFGAPGNRWLDEAISILTVTRSFQAYQQDHTRKHHSKQQLWQHLWKTLFSPEFHLQVWVKRLQACFLSPFPLHNVLLLQPGVSSSAWWLIPIPVGNVCWWGLPLTVFFQMSALL